MLNDNKLLMLSLISMSSKKGWLGITKLQKLSFLMEYLLSKNNKRAFDYEFFMYDLGPISKEVYDDFQFLLNEELIIENERGIRLSEHGNSIYEQFREIVPKDINSAMQSIIDEYASMKTAELVKSVHKMRIRLSEGIITRVGSLPRCTTVLPKPLATTFRIGKEYLETFRIMCDKPLMQTIRQARKKGSKSRPYEPLVSSS